MTLKSIYPPRAFTYLIFRKINAQKDDHEDVKANFQSKFQKHKAELKKIDEENDHLKKRIAKNRESIMNFSEDIEALRVRRYFSFKNKLFLEW